MPPTTCLCSPAASSTTSSSCMFSAWISSDCSFSPRNLVSRDFKLPSGLRITSMISYRKVRVCSVQYCPLLPWSITCSGTDSQLIKTALLPSSAFITLCHSPVPMLQESFCLTWLNWDFADSFNDSKSLFVRYLWGKSKRRHSKDQSGKLD